MRPEYNIARCIYQRCVTVRRKRLPPIVCLCITSACSNSKECENSSIRYLVTDLITEAASNDYQRGNEAANTTYITELISDFENGVKADRENQEAQFNATAGPFP